MVGGRKLLPIPTASPRRVASGFMRVARAHSFALLFGGIWAGIGGLLLAVFTVVSCGFPPMLLGSAIASVFFFVGMIILAYAFYKTAVRNWIYTHGNVVRGRITSSRVDTTYRKNRQPAQRITYGYEDATGTLQTGYDQTFDPGVTRQFPPGTEVDLIVDPYDPSRLFCPALQEIQFESGSSQQFDWEPDVHHTEQLAEPVGTWNCELEPWAPRPDRPFWMPKGTAVSDGNLHATQDALTLSAPDAARSIAWDQPFSVNTTMWPVSDDVAELNITVRRRGAQATGDAVAFKVRVPASRVPTGTARQQARVPTVPTEQFQDLYDRLRFYGQLHGERVELLRAQEALSLPEEHRVEVSVAPSDRGQ